MTTTDYFSLTCKQPSVNSKQCNLENTVKYSGNGLILDGGMYGNQGSNYPLSDTGIT